jgi:hypothetical protein
LGIVWPDKGGKVFWFFFSKKNMLSSFPPGQGRESGMAGPPREWASGACLGVIMMIIM